MNKQHEARVYLSRHNLLTLLSKLDRAKLGDTTFRTIIKSDTHHKTYPQTHECIQVTAVEDKDYYIDREPGRIVPADMEIMNHPSECQLCGLDFEA